MCDSLSEIQQALGRFAAGLDTSGITTADASRLLSRAAVIERLAAALTVRLSARAAQGGSWRSSGSASAVHELARQAGLSLGSAAARLAAGRRLDLQPEVAAAANAGVLSAAQLVAVSDAAAVDPASAGRLVRLAGRGSVGELQAECRQTKATAVDLEARRAAIHARRGLRCWTDPEGAGHLALTENPETIAELMAAITPARERLFQQARRAGVRERGEVLDADALTGFIREAAGHVCPPAGEPAGPAGIGAGGGSRRRARSRPGPGKILVRVDLDTLLRGYPIAGEVCEISGYGPVAVSAVTDMIASGNPFLVAIATRGVAVTGVAHLGRAPTAYQSSALEWAQPGCTVEGCSRVRRLERDHRDPWADTKITLLEGLDRLCEFHHGQKTHHGWALVPGAGKRAFVPPDDPRHPTRQAARPPPQPDG